MVVICRHCRRHFPPLDSLDPPLLCLAAHLHVSLSTVDGSTVELVGGLGSITLSLEGDIDDSGRVSTLVVDHGAGGNGSDLSLEVVLMVSTSS
jgi:hypothetical protein